MSETAVISMDEAAAFLASQATATPESEALMAVAGGTGSGFMPRLQFMSANSKMCKEFDFPTNSYAVVTGKEIGDYLDLGRTVDLHIYAQRPKAISFDDGLALTYDAAIGPDGKSTGLYAEIAAKSLIKVKGEINQNSYGIEYLVFESSTKQFLTYFCNNPTLRNESKKISARRNEKATFTKQLIDTGKFTYNSIKVSDCNTTFETPNPIDAVAAIQKFLAEKGPVPEEEVDEAAAAATGRVQ